MAIVHCISQWRQSVCRKDLDTCAKRDRDDGRCGREDEGDGREDGPFLDVVGASSGFAVISQGIVEVDRGLGDPVGKRGGGGAHHRLDLGYDMV
jgi:hypothetical protein